MGSVQSSASSQSSSSNSGVNFQNFNTSGLEVKIEELTEEESTNYYLEYVEEGLMNLNISQ